jgi:hypothetical protein
VTGLLTLPYFQEEHQKVRSGADIIAGKG